MTRRPPSSTLFPTRRSSDLGREVAGQWVVLPTPSTDGALRLHDDGRQHVSAPRVASVDHRREDVGDRKSTRLNSSHVAISYAVFCLKKKTSNCEQHI